MGETALRENITRALKKDGTWAYKWIEDNKLHIDYGYISPENRADPQSQLISEWEKQS